MPKLLVECKDATGIDRFATGSRGPLPVPHIQNQSFVMSISHLKSKSPNFNGYLSFVALLFANWFHTGREVKDAIYVLSHSIIEK